MAVIQLPDALAARLTSEAELLGMTVEARLVELLDPTVAPDANLKPDAMKTGLDQLQSFLRQLPSVSLISASKPDEPYWWVKFRIDIEDPLAWNIVQALGFALNYLSLDEPLPTVFMPVSPPPYLNGGPEDFLSWVIEAKIPFLDAGAITTILAQRLPSPVEHMEAWRDKEVE